MMGSSLLCYILYIVLIVYTCQAQIVRNITIFEPRVLTVRNGTIYAANYNTIYKMSTNGTSLPFVNVTAVSYSNCIRVDNQGFAIANTYSNELIKMYPNGTFLSQISVPYGSSGFALDANNNIYATDILNNRIVKFSPNGTTLAIFGFVTPFKIAIDVNGNIYSTENAKNRIAMMSGHGILLSYFSILNPFAIALDRDRNIYCISGSTSIVKTICHWYTASSVQFSNNANI